MRTSWMVVTGIGFVLVTGIAAAEPAAPLSALAKMPVKEITVFKDGHAFVLHEGKMPTDGSGNVVMDYLPTPVLGTFWPYSADEKVKLPAVVASRRKVRIERTALNLGHLLEANVGAKVLITEKPAGREGVPVSYPATIAGLPTRSGEELETTSQPNSGEKLPQRGNIILLETAEGMKAVNIDRIQDVTFKAKHRPMVTQEEFRNLLTLKLDWGKARPANDAAVGMLYLQKGVRWIPHYKLTLDGKGGARVQLQATLLNELTDLEDVTVHLVVGVPTFTFENLIDPISLQKRLAQLSEHFRRDSRTAYALSNVLMSQAALPRQEATAGPGPGPGDLGPQVTGAERSEDLFVFDVQHVTLKKGQRMVLPVAEYSLTYKDVYTLDIAFTPPPEVRRNISNQRQAELARLYHAPKVIHQIRLTNKSKYPLTTAPALIIRDERVLGQGMIKYTAIGSETDLAITAAVDISVKKTDKETKRTPNAVQWQGHTYGRIDLAGEIKLTNHRDHAIDLEVTRNVLGNIGEADHDGKPEMVNVFEDATFAPSSGYPYWWTWYNWPYWWHHFNGIGRITWKFRLDADKSLTLGYTWHYYWR